MSKPRKRSANAARFIPDPSKAQSFLSTFRVTVTQYLRLRNS